MDETRDTELDAMSESRDSELGRQLETCGEPEHGPDYWRAVRLAVDEVKAEAAEEAAEWIGEEVRRPGRLGRLRAAFALRRVRLALAAVAVAAAAASALLVGLPGTQGPQPVSAAEVLRRALAVPGSIRTWQADLRLEMYVDWVWKKYHANIVRRVHYMRDVAGGARETYSAITAAGHRLEGPAEEVYDAKTGKGAPYYDEDTGTWYQEYNPSLGGPDGGTIPLIDIGLAVRALSSAHTLRLGETVAGGRPAWTVSCTRSEMAGLPSSDDEPVYTIIVDKQTWDLLGVKQVTKGRVTFSARFSNVRVNEPLPDDAFHLEPPPPGARVERVDLGFHRMTLDEAAAAPRVTPLVPGFVPDGYELSEAAVADRSVIIRNIRGVDVDFTTRHVFALAYRRGFDALTVSTRTIHDPDYRVGIDLCDEFDQAWSRRARTEVPIMSGAFAGATARILVASTTSPPHLWALKDGVLLTICGAATGEELLDMADSLQVFPGPSPTAE